MCHGKRIYNLATPGRVWDARETTMMKIRGSDLSQKLQRECLARFIYRYTDNHTPDWARNVLLNGKPYLSQFASDSDWLENTFFWITKSGELSLKHRYCESYPTWPHGHPESV